MSAIAGFIYPLAAFLYNLVQLVGLFRRERSGSAGEDGLTFFLADPLEPVHEIGGGLQLGRRQRFQILDDGFERAHDFKVPRLGCRGKVPAAKQESERHRRFRCA